MKKWSVIFILALVCIMPALLADAAEQDARGALSVKGEGYPYINLEPKSESTPLKISASISPKTFEAPGSAQVTLDITNISDAPVEVIVIRGEDGTVIEQLSALGQSEPAISRSLNVNVNQEQLDNGKVIFSIAWEQGEESGEKRIGLEIKPLQPKPQLEFERVVSPKIANAGQEVTATYTVKNTGNIRLVDIRVTDEAPFDQSNQINGLKPNDKYTFTTKAVMGEGDIVSKPQVVYALEDGTPQSKSLEPLVISVAKPNLTVSLKADKESVAPGEQVNLIIELVNDGNVEYSKIVISEPKLSDKGDIQPLKAGKTYTYATPVTVDSSTSYTFTVTATDSTKTKITALSNTVNIAVTSDINVALSAVPRTDIITEPGVVTFDVAINNKGGISLGQTVLSVDGIGEINSVAELPAGVTRFEVPVDVDETSAFQFSARVSDKSGNMKNITAQGVTVEVRKQDEAAAFSVVDLSDEGETPEDDGAEEEPRSVQEQTVEPGSWMPAWVDVPYVVTVVSIILIVLIVICLIALVAVSVSERGKKIDGGHPRRGSSRRNRNDVRDVEPENRDNDNDNDEHEDSDHSENFEDSEEFEDSDEKSELDSYERDDGETKRIPVIGASGEYGRYSGGDSDTKTIPVARKPRSVAGDDPNTVDPTRRRSQRKR